MAAMLYVRIKSALDADQLERRTRFRAVRGLVQKFYGRDQASGDMRGIDIFRDHKALAASRESKSAKSIPAAYEAAAIRREAYEILFPLYPERGPLAE